MNRRKARRVAVEPALRISALVAAACATALMPALGTAATAAGPGASPAFAWCTNNATFTPLHPGDKINVAVLDHAELSGDATVAADGSVAVAQIGPVSTKGCNLHELAMKIQALLGTILLSPAVDVRLVSLNTAAYLSGAVSDTITLKPNETLMDAVSAAKLPIAADVRRVTVLRNGTPVVWAPAPPPIVVAAASTVPAAAPSTTLSAGAKTEFDIRTMRGAGESGPVLQPGDVITIPNKPVIVEVTGAVQQAVTAYLDADEPLGDALQQAQLAKDANVERILVRRAPATSPASTALSPSPPTTSPKSKPGGTTACVDPLVNTTDSSKQKVFYATIGGSTLAQPGHSGDSLSVGRAANVVVLGAVQRAGPVVLKGDQSLVSALNLAGGPAKSGDLVNVKVTCSSRGGGAVTYDVAGFADDLSKNPDLSDGDIVYVPNQKTKKDFRVIFSAIMLLVAKKAKLPKI